jgi:hypothetical protein
MYRPIYFIGHCRRGYACSGLDKLVHVSYLASLWILLDTGRLLDLFHIETSRLESVSVSSLLRGQLSEPYDSMARKMVPRQKSLKVAPPCTTCNPGRFMRIGVTVKRSSGGSLAQTKKLTQAQCLTLHDARSPYLFKPYKVDKNVLIWSSFITFHLYITAKRSVYSTNPRLILGTCAPFAAPPSRSSIC